MGDHHRPTSSTLRGQVQPGHENPGPACGTLSRSRPKCTARPRKGSLNRPRSAEIPLECTAVALLARPSQHGRHRPRRKPHVVTGNGEGRASPPKRRITSLICCPSMRSFSSVSRSVVVSSCSPLG
jgi:hypothetical protein